MAGATRSGRLLKKEGASSSKSVSAVGKAKDKKGSTTSSSTASGSTASGTRNKVSRNKVNSSVTKEVKGSTISFSTATDSYSLRRSTRETPTKKMKASSPSSGKHERLENQAPSTPSEKKKFEKLGKKRPRSPLRRSERIEKNVPSSSSGSRKSKKSSSPENETKKKDKNVKFAAAGDKEHSKAKKLDIKRDGLLEKKKRLNARRYRALLTPQPKKAKCSDSDGIRLKDGGASKGNSCGSASSDSKLVHEGGDDCNRRKEEELSAKHSDAESKEAVEGSSSGSRELAELTLGNDGQRKSARLSGKRKLDDRSLVPKCSGSSSQSSLVGLTSKDNGGSCAERESDGENDKLDDHGLGTEEMEAPECMASTSDRKSLAVDISAECERDFGSSKRTKMAADLDSDISVTAVNKELLNVETSTADATSSPSEAKINHMNRCTACCKLERVCNCSETQELCSCKAQTRHDPMISISKEACEPIISLGNPCHGAVCSLEVQTKGDLLPEAREQASGCERQHCLVTSSNAELVSVPMAEDRGSHGACDSIGAAEEHLSASHVKESSPAVQADSGTNVCVVCKQPGVLLCCDGKDCKRTYHLSCLYRPLQDVPPGVWLCIFCVKKKAESGVYSVSNGIESIWDVKEVAQVGKHYFVKYRGLSHVHNRWISESQVLLEAPMLVAKFNRRYQKEKVTRWKKEWTEPYRLLQKRLCMPEILTSESFSGHGDGSCCYHEWFVKWKGLGYEFATWEFENSPFLCSSEATMLIQDYENRRNEAKRASDPLRVDKALQVKKSPFHRLARLPDGCSAGLDNDHLNSVNRLYEFWHKSQNAVFIDDQERIIKFILFIASLRSHTCQPFLIISTMASLSLWENEFVRLAPSINAVVYNGNKDIRKMIRTLEFYEEGGCIMFQVLLSHPDAIIEDFEAVDCIGWEAVVIDECQNSRVSKHLEHFKNLSTDFRLLLLNSQLKDNLAEYINLLSFLEAGGKEDGASSLKCGLNDISGDIAILKERFARYLAYERKPDSSKFVEFWVPVRLSNVQLEQYCSALVSNLITLRSCSKVDQVGALRDILISTRKCCDHPYIVDQRLQSSLTNGLPADEYLDIGVKASGKLLLLDKFLQEIKKQGFRVLILFQSIGGAGRNSIGDILDDFLRQRFGGDSYERVDSGLVMSKKLAALNMFNDKTKGRFVFLIENRACLPSVKLSSVDAVIIFDSDWNPLNDLRALQRISIESQFDHVKVFRLFSSYTVEEKVLIFAKQDMILESNIQSISPTNSHLLLSWGASNLFSELDEFHRHEYPSNYSTNSAEKPLLNDAMLNFSNDVVLELLKQLPRNAESSNIGDFSILIKAQQSGMSYSRNIILVGEKDGICSLDKDPHSFWSNLLENRYPRWRFISEPSQRIRRKVQNLEESTKTPEVENDDVRKKRRKLTSNNVDPIFLQTWLQAKTKGFAASKDAAMPGNLLPSGVDCSTRIPPKKSPVILGTMPKQPESYVIEDKIGSQYMPNATGIGNHITNRLHASPMSGDTSELHKPYLIDSERGGKLRNAQSTLHISLKPELSKLCDTMKLPEDVKALAHRFLEYIMNNHRVSREPESILQAFQISLCWRAASFLKHKVDHRECLELAKKYLKFTCSEEQAESVYSKLRMLKKFFSQSSTSRNENEPKSSGNQSSESGKVNAAEQMHEGHSNSTTPSLQPVGDSILITHSSCEQFSRERDQAPSLETPPKNQENVSSLKDTLLKRRVDLIDKICSKREEGLLLKQQIELSDFNVRREEEKMKLKRAHDLELDLIHAIHINYTVRNNKIKLLNQEFSGTMSEFDQHMNLQRRKLAAMQEAARNKEHEIRTHWLEEAKTGTLAESFDKLPLTESGFRLQEVRDRKQVEAFDGSGDTGSVSQPALDQICNGMKSFEISSELPNGTIEDVLLETETPNPEASSMVEVEYAEVNRTSAETLPAILPPDASNIPRETVSPPSQLDIVNGESIGPDVNCSIVIEATTNETETLASQPNNVVEVECLDPTGISVEISGIATLPMEGDMPETGPLSSHLENINAADDVPNAMLTGSTMELTTETINREQHEGESNSSGACLIASPQQRQAEVPSLSPESTNPVYGNCATSAPASSLNEHARLAGVGRGSSSPQQIAVLVSHSVHGETSQVEPTAASTINSDSLLLQTPLSIGNFSNGNGQGSTFAPVASEGERHVGGPYCSNQHTGVLMQQQAVTSTLPVEQSIPLVTQSTVHPVVAIMPAGRTRAEDLERNIVRPESGSRFLQTFPMVHSQVVCTDIFQNELMRIRKQDEARTKMHEDKKMQLKLELEQELEKVRRKYDTSLQDAEAGFLQDKKILETIYNKILMNRILAEEFRAKFIENKDGASASFQGPRPSSMQQFPQPPPQLPHPLRPSSVANPALAAISGNLPPVRIPSPTVSSRPIAGLRANVSAVASVSSGPVVHHSTPIVPTSQVRSHFSPMLPPRSNLQAGTEARAPAPHLQRFRPQFTMPPSNIPRHTSQMVNQQHPQHPLPNLGSAASVAPVSSAYQSMASLSGIHQSGVPSPLPIYHGTLLPSVDLPQDARDPAIGVELPNLPHNVEVGPPDGWQYSLAMMANELAASNMVAARHAGAGADVVCLSDDD